MKTVKEYKPVGIVMAFVATVIVTALAGAICGLLSFLIFA